MTREEAKEKLYIEWQKFLENNIDYAGVSEAYKMAFKALEQEPCEDCISRQAVLDGLASIAKVKARSDAQKSLIGRSMFFVEQLSPVIPQPCEDCISRQEVKRKLQEHHDFFIHAYNGFSNMPQNNKSRVDEITNCIAMVVNEPSVTPQPKIGRWIYDRNIENWRCSECNETPKTMGYVGTADFMAEHFKYCNNCGAKMEEVEE